jgi:MFS family permease
VLRLIGLVGAVFLAQLGITGMNVALPTLAVAFGAPAGAVQAVVVAYLVLSTAGLLVAGPLGDRLGRRRVLLAGFALFIVASLIGSMATTLPVLVAARAVQGFGGAALAAMSIALVLDAFPRSQAGATLGVLSTTSAVATTLGPSLGGLLLAGFGWRALPAVNVPIGLAAAALVAFTLGDTPPAKQSAPLFDVALVQNPRLAGGLVASALVAVVMITTLTIGPFVLASGMGLPAAAIGFVMAVGPLVSVLLAVPAGRLADRVGARTTTVWALAVLSIGAVLVALVVDRHNVVLYTCAIVVLSVGYALFQTPNSAAVMAEAAADRRATVAGLLNLSRNLGFIAGAGAMGAGFSATGAPATVFAATAALGVLALAIAASPAVRIGHVAG